MHESVKLEEAKYFLGQMAKEELNPEVFKHNLSAFLSSARSILQYSLEEAENKANGKAWYDAHMNGNQLLKYFKEKRNVSIHTEPVKPRRHITFTKTIGPSSSFRIIGEKSEYKSPPKDTNAESEHTAITHNFVDWKGSEDVLTLCRRYLGDLEAFIIDGIAQGFISG
ncbi:MAG: hypothetical protein HY599_00495 [Candidatus Omnitrophica bacterium]|nr:hypothetical protein [Candidatus Omnitrophota bacterium]